MTDDSKFLGVAGAVLTILIIWPVLPGTAILLGLGLLVLLYLAASRLRPW